MFVSVERKMFSLFALRRTIPSSLGGRRTQRNQQKERTEKGTVVPTTVTTTTTTSHHTQHITHTTHTHRQSRGMHDSGCHALPRAAWLSRPFGCCAHFSVPFFLFVTNPPDNVHITESLQTAIPPSTPHPTAFRLLLGPVDSIRFVSIVFPWG